MEENNNMSSELQHCSSPFSWWWDSHNRPPQSQWLHSTLAELDENIKKILELIEDNNGDTLAKRAEMYYQKRPQLIEMVQELHRSYRALADKYDQLKSESSIKASNNGSLSNSFRKPLGPRLRASTLSGPKPVIININDIEQPNFNSEDFSADESTTSSFEFNSPTDLITSLGSSDNLRTMKKDNKNIDNRFAVQEHGMMTMRENVVWDEQMKFSKLLEENLCKQAELIRRNDEKREVINELRNENRILSHKASVNSSSHNKGTIKGNHESQRRKFVRGLFCLA